MLRIAYILVFSTILIGGCDTVNEDGNGLLGYWSFNDEFTADNSGNGNDAISHGAQAADGVLGQSANLGGTGFLEIPGDMHSATTDNSISFWFYKANATVNNDFEALAWSGRGLGEERDFALTLTEFRPPFVLTLSTGSDPLSLTTVNTEAVVRPGRWHHVTAVVTPQKVSLYLDGTDVGGVSTVSAPPKTGSPILIGKAVVSSGPERFFNGRVDEIRLYSRALAHSEILRLYEARM